MNNPVLNGQPGEACHIKRENRYSSLESLTQLPVNLIGPLRVLIARRQKVIEESATGREG